MDRPWGQKESDMTERLEAVLHNNRRRGNEKPSAATREWPPIAQGREKSEQQRGPSTAKIK